MNAHIRESKILWENAKYLGFDLLETYMSSAELMVKDILKTHSSKNSFGVLTGKGGNGTDGLAIALSLYKNGVDEVSVYIPHPTTKLQNSISEQLIEKIKNTEIALHINVSPEEVEQPDIFIEALVGTGLEKDTLRKKYRSYVKRFSHFGSKKIAIDAPAPHYTPDTVYSLHVPKYEKAKVIETTFPKEAYYFCGPGEHEYMEKPNSKTHTKKNGEIMIIAEDATFKNPIEDAAKSLVSKVHFITMNNLDRKKFENIVESSDVISFGNLENDFLSRAIFEKIITESSKKPIIIYGDSLKLLKKADTTWLENALLIIKKNELSKPDFDLKESTIKRFCKTHGISVLLLGNRTTLCNTEGEVRMLSIDNVSHPQLVPYLATTIASHAVRNDLWLATRASMYF